jgi:hypothetical protein
MDIQEIRKRVEAIRNAQGDPEAAHVLEDRLHRDVLEAIERDCDGDAYLWARAALKSWAIDFPRFCA